VYDAYKIQAP